MELESGNMACADESLGRGGRRVSSRDRGLATVTSGEAEIIDRQMGRAEGESVEVLPMVRSRPGDTVPGDMARGDDQQPLSASHRYRSRPKHPIGSVEVEGK